MRKSQNRLLGGMSESCVFCRILDGTEPASFVHEDDACVAFLTMHQVREGEILVIPRSHIDEFTDLEDEVASHIMVVAQRKGRVLRTILKPDRIGYVVHGYGVPHAHLIILPQHDVNDITSARFAEVTTGPDEVHIGAPRIA